MNSWRLFISGIVFWEAYESPIFVRQTEQKPIWYNSIHAISSTPGLALALVAGGLLPLIIIVLYFKNFFLFLLLPRFLLISATGLTIAPLVVDERVKGNWETLLAMPFSPRELLLGKVGGALWWLRYAFLAISALLFLVALSVGFVSLALIPTKLPGANEVPIFVLCVGVLVLPVVWSIVFVVDRVQQFLLVISTAVAVSTSTSSPRTAFFSSMSAILIVWMMEAVFAGIVVTLQAGHSTLVSETSLLALVTLGPVVNFIVELNLAQTVFWTLCTLLGREIAIRSLWSWAEHRARSF